MSTSDGLPTGSEGETVERVVDRVLRTWYPHSAITETVAYAVRDALAGQGGGWEPEPDFRCVLPLPSWFTIDQKLDVEEAVRDAIYRVAPGKDIYVRAVLAASPPEAKKRPEIVCLCGSTRFADQHAVKRWELERDGSAIVLMINYLPAWYADKQGWNGHDHYGEIAGNKSVLDELHFRKIDMADHVLVVNPGGYYGDSTRREIEYARSIGKPVAFTDGETGGAWLHDFGIYSYRCLVCGTTVDDAPVQPCKERSAAPTEASEEHEPLGDGPDTCFASPDGQLKCMEEEGHAGPHRDPFAPGGEVTWPVEPEGGER